ncbi:MAG: hypothetical protein K0M56_03900 [Kaistella sp.]|nr:hypothetical protein [Kaistella sp.]
MSLTSSNLRFLSTDDKSAKEVQQWSEESIKMDTDEPIISSYRDSSLCCATFRMTNVVS